MRTYVIGVFLAFLPARWREARFAAWSVNWPRATIISGLLESFVALLALIVWYSIFVTGLAGIIGGRAGGFDGYVGLFSLALHPLTWLLCYFGCEGAVRFLPALSTQECYGTLPLWLVMRILDRRESGRSGKFLPDEVTRSDGGSWDLTIASSDSKSHWKYPLSIRYKDEFFQVIGDEHFTRAAARPHVYRLRRLPANEIIKGLEPYDPSALDEESPGFFAAVAAELRKK